MRIQIANAKWILVFLGKLLSWQLLAQDYLINHEGDTLRVYVVKSFKATNARKLTYKIAEESLQEEVLTPDKVRAFMAGNYFVRIELQREGNKEYLFAQEIINNGKIVLYKSVDENGYPDFFIKKEGTVVAVDKNNFEQFVENYFSDCPQFEKEKYLSNSADAYRQNFLMDLVSQYNHCTDPEIPYIRYFEPVQKRQKRKDELHFGVRAGGGAQEYAYRSFGTGANADLYGTALFNWQPSFAAGVYGNVQYGKVFGVYLEATYLYRNAQSTDQRIQINFSGINLPFYTEFKILPNNKKICPFIATGLNTLVGIGQKYRFNDPPNITQLRPLSISPVSFGYLANVGTYLVAGKKPLKIEFRFTEDFFEVNNRTFGDDKMKVANFMLYVSYLLL